MSDGYKKVLIHVACRTVSTVEVEVPEEYTNDEIQDKAWEVGCDYDGCYDVEWEDLGG